MTPDVYVIKCCIYVAGLTQAGCLLPPDDVWNYFAGSRCVVCDVYCCSMLYLLLPGFRRMASLCGVIPLISWVVACRMSSVRSLLFG